MTAVSPGPGPGPGATRAAAGARAVAAWNEADVEEAERAALLFFGFAPPQRPSGDIEKPLPPDARYRRVARELYAARVLALTGGARAQAPSCCSAQTRLAAGDRTGFAAIALPTDAGGAPDEDSRRDAW